MGRCGPARPEQGGFGDPETTSASSIIRYFRRRYEPTFRASCSHLRSSGRLRLPSADMGFVPLRVNSAKLTMMPSSSRALYSAFSLIEDSMICFDCDEPIVERGDRWVERRKRAVACSGG